MQNDAGSNLGYYNGVLFPSGVNFKYIVSALSACQALWLMNLLQDFKIRVNKPVKLMIDKKSAISLANNPVLHGRRKHINMKFHFMRNQIQNGMLEVFYCSTLKQLAIVLTRAIKTEQFINLRDKIDVIYFSLLNMN